MDELKELVEAIEKFGLAQAPELQDRDILNRIRSFAILMWVKNQQMNLTRHTTWDLFVSRDLMDTLVLSRLIPDEADVLDVGSGGGVPGMLLAILRPDLQVTLTDSVRKKAMALNEFADALELNVAIFNDRVESVLQDLRFDVVTARAVGPLSKLLRWFDGHWMSMGRLLAVKGPKWKEELEKAHAENLTDHLVVGPVATYPTPGTDWESVVLQVGLAPVNGEDEIQS